jgi:hypothetical protein
MQRLHLRVLLGLCLAAVAAWRMEYAGVRLDDRRDGVHQPPPPPPVALPETRSFWLHINEDVAAAMQALSRAEIPPCVRPADRAIRRTVAFCLMVRRRAVARHVGRCASHQVAPRPRPRWQVRDVADVVVDYIRYHRAVGAAVFIAYVDARSEDNTWGVLHSLPGVVVRNFTGNPLHQQDAFYDECVRDLITETRFRAITHAVLFDIDELVYLPDSGKYADIATYLDNAFNLTGNEVCVKVPRYVSRGAFRLRVRPRSRAAMQLYGRLSLS